jgi:hypothetical protein
MAAVLHARTEATALARAQELSSTLQRKLAQGYRVESQDDTQAVLLMRGRKRWFRPSVDSRQIVKVDEFGTAKVEKIDNAGG